MRITAPNETLPLRTSASIWYDLCNSATVRSCLDATPSTFTGPTMPYSSTTNPEDGNEPLPGQPFRRIIPASESVSAEETEPVEPGVLVLRCAKCHKIVPREHVLPDKPLAKCPDCGFVFEPQELNRNLTLTSLIAFSDPLTAPPRFRRQHRFPMPAIVSNQSSD